MCDNEKYKIVYNFFFFFKQKTAYEMRISDWSSDVCSSDLAVQPVDGRLDIPWHAAVEQQNRPLPTRLQGVADHCRRHRVASGPRRRHADVGLGKGMAERVERNEMTIRRGGQAPRRRLHLPGPPGQKDGTKTGRPPRPNTGVGPST